MLITPFATPVRRPVSGDNPAMRPIGGAFVWFAILSSQVPAQGDDVPLILELKSAHGASHGTWWPHPMTDDREPLLHEQECRAHTSQHFPL